MMAGTVHFYRFYFGYRTMAEGFSALNVELAFDWKDECEARGVELSIGLIKILFYVGFDLEYATKPSIEHPRG